MTILDPLTGRLIKDQTSRKKRPVGSKPPGTRAPTARVSQEQTFMQRRLIFTWCVQ
jgi:hypothetical protein